STAYGVEAYQAAWLKRYFPAEFMAAVLTNGKGFYDPLVYVLESHRLGLKLLPPAVNEPGPGFQVVTSSCEPEGRARHSKTVSKLRRDELHESLIVQKLTEKSGTRITRPSEHKVLG